MGWRNNNLMKYLLLPIALIVVTMLTSCKENVKQTSSQIETVQSTITVISPKEVYDSLQEDQSLQLLDVRTPEEYGVTH